MAVMGHRAVQDFWAIRAGDVTQKIQKRDFLYYLRSFDILGFLCFPIFGFGWGKPTQSPKAISGSKTMQRVGIISSGCFFNFLVAITAQLLIFPVESASLFMAGQLQLFSQINMYYCLLSLLPIPPLDGWLLYKAIRKQRVKLDQESFYGEIIILVGMVTYIMPWAIHYVTQALCIGFDIRLSLYPIVRSNSFLSFWSCSVSKPFGEKPSTTPTIPFPCFVSTNNT